MTRASSVYAARTTRGTRIPPETSTTLTRGQEFVIAGYTRGTKTFDALIFRYYEGDKLIYVARTRNRFTPVTRAQLFRKFKELEIN